MTSPSSAQEDQALTALPSHLIFLNLEGVRECQPAQSKALGHIAWGLSLVILVSLMNHHLLRSLKRVIEHLHIHLKAWSVVAVLLKILHFFFAF